MATPLEYISPVNTDHGERIMTHFGAARTVSINRYTCLLLPLARRIEVLEYFKSGKTRGGVVQMILNDADYHSFKNREDAAKRGTYLVQIERKEYHILPNREFLSAEFIFNTSAVPVYEARLNEDELREVSAKLMMRGRPADPTPLQQLTAHSNGASWYSRAQDAAMRDYMSLEQTMRMMGGLPAEAQDDSNYALAEELDVIKVKVMKEVRININKIEL